VTRLQPLGQGALELAFQQVRAKLEAEGLFKVERKKPLPPYPARIALVTSRQTAALQDMFKVLRRYPWLRLFVYHVPVQGDGAAEKIAAALAHLNASHQQLGGIDLILLARGGGSLEDLWQFNEERVARAIVASVIPVVTGIGHEVDVSIADLVADHHAHTPTEAAQVAVQRWRNARDDLTSAGIRLRRALRTRMQETRARLRAVEQHEYFRRPLDRVNALRQLLDDRQRALSLAVGRRLRLAHQRLFGLASALRERHPRHAIQLEAQRLRSIQSRLGRLMLDDHRRRTARLDALGARLNALDPQKVLARGYSITTLKRTGALARRAAELTPGDRLVTRLADGSVESTVEDAAQGTLFTK
jgi:exodeoxyribonuclease VII large subunit